MMLFHLLILLVLLYCDRINLFLHGVDHFLQTNFHLTFLSGISGLCLDYSLMNLVNSFEQFTLTPRDQPLCVPLDRLELALPAGLIVYIFINFDHVQEKLVISHS